VPRREHVALGEWPRFGVAVAKPGDAVVEQPPPGPQYRGELSRVGVDVCAADVLDHADRGDRIELLAGKVAVVADADLDPVGEPRRRRPLARERGLRLGQRDGGDVAPCASAACSAKLPHPQPTSRTRSPARTASFVHTSSSFARCASSSVWGFSSNGAEFSQARGNHRLRPIAEVRVGPAGGRKTAGGSWNQKRVIQAGRSAASWIWTERGAQSSACSACNSPRRGGRSAEDRSGRCAPIVSGLRCEGLVKPSPHISAVER
jgi:hypothetical protein